MKHRGLPCPPQVDGRKKKASLPVRHPPFSCAYQYADPSQLTFLFACSESMGPHAHLHRLQFGRGRVLCLVLLPIYGVRNKAS